MRPHSSIHWNAYPALLAAGAMSAGILAAKSFEINVLFWIVGVACILLGALATLRPGSFSRTAPHILLVGGCIFAAGGLRYADYAAPAPSDVSVMPAGSTARLYGRPFDGAAARSGIRYTLRVDSALVLGRIQPLSGRVLVYVRGGDERATSPCGRISVEGTVEALPEVRNPGDFDYAGYLRGRRIFVRMFAEEMTSVGLPKSATFDALCIAHRLKTKIEGYFERSIPDDGARAIILALVVGDRSAIDTETEARFRRTGLLHLLAVSGLHVLIVGMILYQLLRPLLLRFGLSWLTAEYARTALTAVVLVLYALVTGLPASVVRAVIMAILFMIGATFQRSSHSLNTLGVAGLLLLVMRPAQLFEPGFQLSVAAVAAIVSLQSQFTELLEVRGKSSHVGRSIRSSTAVSLAAAAGTLPVLLIHFGSVSFAGLFLNTLAVPLTSATLASSVTTAAASSMSDTLGGTFGIASQFFAQVLLYVVEHGEPYFRWAYLESPVEDTPVVAALVLSIFTLAQWPRPRLRWRLCAAVLALLAIDMVWDAAEGEWTSSLDIVFLDVDQGDAALFTFPNGRTMLVDAGPRTAFSDAGRYTILPHLRRMQIHALDAVVITHPDSDHLGGLPTLLRHVTVKRVLHSGRPHDSALYSETMSVLDSLAVPYQAVRTGDTLSIDPTTRVYVMHPDHPHLQDGPNESSVVLHLRYGSTSILMMGDAERDAEEAVVRRFGEMAAADVIKVGHHGSETSSTPLLLSRVVQPKTIGVISVGRKNRFGHPDSVVVRRLRDTGAAVHRTDREGAVHLQGDGRTFTIRSWR